MDRQRKIEIAATILVQKCGSIGRACVAMSGFNWSETPEGLEFWADVRVELENRKLLQCMPISERINRAFSAP